MSETQPHIVNKVVNSGIITLDLSGYITDNEIVELDISQYLFQGLLLKESDFRKSMENVDWQSFNNKVAAIYCSTDAIIPQWAGMLITKHLVGITKDVYYGTAKEYKQFKLLEKLNQLDMSEFEDKRVILKGCGDEVIDHKAYTLMSMKLLPVVKSLMYGEACSNVPIYKKK